MVLMPTSNNQKEPCDWKPLLDKALQMQRRGDLQEAVSICKEVLSYQPGQPDALHLQGLLAYRNARSHQAVALLKKAFDAKPSDLNICKNLILILIEMGQWASAASYCKKALLTGSGNYAVYQGLGDLFFRNGLCEEAASCYQKVIELKPELASAWGNLGCALEGCRRFDEAVASYRRALTLDPGNPDLYYNLAIAFNAKGMIGPAVSNFKKALVFNPGHTRALFNLGNVFKRQGDLVQAATCYQECLRLDEADIDARYNLANTLYVQGNLQAAVTAYEQTISRKPDHILAMNNLGCALKDIGANDQAAAILSRAIEINPNNTAAYVNLGNLYKEINDFKNAFNAYRKALSMEPDNQDALVSMGSLLKKEGRFTEGLEYLERALTLSPGISNAWWYYYLALPILYKTKTDIVEHRRRFSNGLAKLTNSVKLNTAEQRKKALSGVGSITNFYLQYQGENDIELQKHYGRFVHNVMAANYPEWATTRPMPSIGKNGKIRIGYLSSFMRAHTVGHFLMGWLKNHDRTKYDIHGYYIGRKEDDLTVAFKERFDHFHHIPGNIEAMAKQIVDDRLHLLTYTDIGMFAPATQLAALRLAPVQCKGWGHPVTTGLPTINYYLSSDLMEPEAAQAHYSETLVRLPNLALALDAPLMAENGKTRKDFGLSEENFVYLTSQSLFKYLPQYDPVYPAIASRVKNAVVVFICNPSAGITDRFKKRIEKAFRAHNLEMDRFCKFQPRLSPDEFLSLNKVSDALLDPFSWSGGKTTLEGLSCGLPVVTCPGRFMRGRHAFAMLKMMGITETIAADMESYIDIACRLGNDREFYGRMRFDVQSRRHRLYNDLTSIRALESFYRQVVEAKLAEMENQPFEQKK